MPTVFQQYSARDFARASGCAIIQKGAENLSLKHLLIDSRMLMQASGSVFFALKSNKNDGHKYVTELYKKGVRAFVVSDFSEEWPEACPNAFFFQSKDVLARLQQLAGFHRNQFDIPVLAITGSNGKTTVKEWLRILLSKDKQLVASPKSYNSQLGVPLSVWQINARHELGIFEAGISRPGEMEKLEAIIRPWIGIFTNIGSAHSADFKNIRQKIHEKLLLFKNASTLICSSQNRMLYREIIAFAMGNSIGVFSWGSLSSDDIKITANTESPKGRLLSYEFCGGKHQLELPFRDEASVENVLHCLAFMLYQGHSPEELKDSILQLSPLALRLEQKSGRQNTVVINDSYNSDLESLRIALDFLKRQKQYQKKSLVLSDIQESGLSEQQLFAEVKKMLEGMDLHRIIGVGTAMQRHLNTVAKDARCFFSTEDFLNHISEFNFHDEAILLKGARSFAFEQIGHALEAQTHETLLEVNLDALVHNLNYYRNKIPAGVKIMAMVKANAYGAGSAEVAGLLQFHHVDYLAVAYADEGVELRKAGVKLPIMVMNPEESAFDDMLQYQLEPEIFSFSQLKKFAEKARQKLFYKSSLFKIHIKLDTGMRRLGFETNELQDLPAVLAEYPFIRVQTVFTHLAASDEAEQDDFTSRQIGRFTKAVEFLSKSLEYKFLSHVLNTAGITRHPNSAFDMVRLGLGLYGISPLDDVQKELRPISRLKTRISQVKTIRKGESVGYSRSFSARDDMHIAIVPIGYADGVNRHLSNKGHFLLHGQKVPIIGNVCMDMCMIDVTEIPSAAAGDEVIIFGPELLVSDLADEAETIPYELLTAVSHRVKRVYFHE